MIDFTKIALLNIDVKRLCDLLDFNFVVSEKTGEISTKKVAKYHFCDVIIYDSGFVLFTGSIHKLWNSLNNVLAPNYKETELYKGFNGNQFTINDIAEVRKHLETLFNCTPQQMIFQNIEFGFNTTPNFDPQLFVKGLLYHNGKIFDFKHSRCFARAVHQRYKFKIYNKSNQYGMQEHTLRIELKLMTSDQFAPLGIKTFADINTSTLNKAKELILKRFDEVVYYDNTITKEDFTDRQKYTLLQYSKPSYWIDELTPKNRDYHKKKLNNLIVDYSENIHQQIKQNIIQKFVIITSLSECKNTLPITSLSEKDKFVIITSSSIDVIITNNPPKKQPTKTDKKPIEKQGNKNTKKKGIKIDKKKVRKCVVTGLDISMQKEGSFMLSHTGLKYYYKNSKKEFKILKNKYLSKKWIGADFETQIKQLAHNIRNKKSNVEKQKELKYNSSQVVLF